MKKKGLQPKINSSVELSKLRNGQIISHIYKRLVLAAGLSRPGKSWEGPGKVPGRSLDGTVKT